MESVIGWDGVYGTVALLYLFGPLLIARVAAWDVFGVLLFPRWVEVPDITLLSPFKIITRSSQIGWRLFDANGQ